MDSSLREPQRLSALYQYHNAPEVAPAHGLEYDDTIYPSSDKFPVVRERAFSRSEKYAFSTSTHPPIIIFGMKLRTFLLVATVMTVVVVGAAVGGGVGGRQLRQKQQQQAQEIFTDGASPSATAPASGTPSATSTFTAATPTYTPLNDCPQSNNTDYTSAFASGASGDVPEDAGLRFTKHCDLSDPLAANGTTRIAEAFVYTFSDCVEVCAGYNFWNNGTNCTVAVYQPTGGRPGNCWVGHADHVKASELSLAQGTEVAILHA